MNDSIGAQPLSDYEKTLVKIAAVCAAYGDNVPWLERASLHMAAVFVVAEHKERKEAI